MKTLKFTTQLCEDILKGKKNKTWRLFDDKDLKVGDEVELINSDTKEPFARAELTSVVEKPFSEIENSDYSDDYKGHEIYSSDEEMYKTFSGYYNRSVDKNTLVKIIQLKIKELD